MQELTSFSEIANILAVKAGDALTVKINEKPRYAVVLARRGAYILIEYLMKHTTALRILSVPVLCLHGAGTTEDGAFLYIGRPTQYHKLSFAWLDAIVAQGVQWYGLPQRQETLPGVRAYTRAKRERVAKGHVVKLWQKEQDRLRESGRIWENQFPGIPVVQARRTRTPIPMTKVIGEKTDEEKQRLAQALFEE